MAVLCTELVRRERKLSDRIRDYRRIIACNAQIVIITSVDRKIIVSWACAADRTAHTCYTTWLSDDVGRKHCEIQRASVQCASGVRELSDVVRIKVVI